MKFHSKWGTALAALLLSSTLALSACGGDDGTAEGRPRAAATWPSRCCPEPRQPHFDTSTAGAERAAEEIGASLEEVGPQEATPDAQVQYINTAAQQGVGALIVSANDPTRSATPSTRPARPGPPWSPSTPTPTRVP